MCCGGDEVGGDEVEGDEVEEAEPLEPSGKIFVLLLKGGKPCGLA